MRVVNLGFNQGSLLRRTLVHVVAFVLGSVAVIGVLSFVSVSVAKGVLTAAEAPATTTSRDAVGVDVPTKMDATKGRALMKSRVGSSAVRTAGKDG